MEYGCFGLSPFWTWFFISFSVTLNIGLLWTIFRRYP